MYPISIFYNLPTLRCVQVCVCVCGLQPLSVFKFILSLIRKFVSFLLKFRLQYRFKIELNFFSASIINFEHGKKRNRFIICIRGYELNYQ